MPLSTRDRNRMAATLTAHLPDTCDIYLLTETSDGMGGTETQSLDDATPTDADVPFLLSPNRTKAGSERPRSGGIWDDSDWIGTLPAGTEITASHILVHNEKAYEVVRESAGRTNELQVKVGLVRRGDGS